MNIPTKPPIIAALAAALITTSAFANLIPINVVPSTGNGLGAVNTLVTFQNTGTEIGAVGAGAGGTLVTGSTVAFGIGSPTTPTNETAGGAGNNIYTATALGITSGGTTTFANVVLLVNANEGGTAPETIYTLDRLSLNLFSNAGALLGSFSTTQAYTYDALAGIGNAGFGFQLDAIQAAQANALLSTPGGVFIGTAARVTGANAGPETVAISRLNSTQPPGTAVPDSGPTVALLGGALLVGALFHRYKR